VTASTAPGAARDAPVAPFINENAQGKRLSLPARRKRMAKETAFVSSQSGATNVLYRIDRPLGYALAREVPREDLPGLAT